MLSDTTIRRLVNDGVIRIVPVPFDYAYQPASVDLCLGRSFIDIHGDNEATYLDPHTPFILQPGRCALACTLETIGIPNHLVGRVEGKSSWGRRFLMVHSTAGFIDPGFAGQITLELVNLGREPITLYSGVAIAQISFQRLDAPARRPYGSEGLDSHYQHQQEATRSWMS